MNKKGYEMTNILTFKGAEIACGFSDTTDTAGYLGVSVERVWNLRRDPFWFVSTEAKELCQLARDGG